MPARSQRKPPASRSRPLGRRGASSLEFAIVAIPLFLLIFSGMELARYSASLASLRALVDETARAASLRGYANMAAGSAPCANITAANLLPSGAQTYLVDPTRLTLSVDSCVTSGPVTTVTMTARYQHAFMFALLSSYSGTVVETATAAFN